MINYEPTTHGGPLQIFITDGLGWSLQAFPAGFLVPNHTHWRILYLIPSFSHSAAHCKRVQFNYLNG